MIRSVVPADVCRLEVSDTFMVGLRRQFTTDLHNAVDTYKSSNDNRNPSWDHLIDLIVTHVEGQPTSSNPGSLPIPGSNASRDSAVRHHERMKDLSESEKELYRAMYAVFGDETADRSQSAGQGSQ
jgi:hypothetical protein